MGCLEGKVAIVSGAGDVFGAACVEMLSREGAAVTATDADEQVRAIALKVQEASGNRVDGLIADLSNRDDVEGIVADTIGHHGRLDLLINNAAVWRRSPIDMGWEQALAVWDAVMEINVKGMLMLSRACIPHLKKQGGDIVNVTTNQILPARASGANPIDTDVFNASRWAVNGFTDAWSKALAADGVRVNGVCIPQEARMDGEARAQAQHLQPRQMAQLVLALLNDGRTGENIGCWLDAPAELPPRAAANRRITG